MTTDQEWEENGHSISDAEHRSLHRSNTWLREDMKEIRATAETRYNRLVWGQIGTLLAVIGLLGERIW